MGCVVTGCPADYRPSPSRAAITSRPSWPPVRPLVPLRAPYPKKRAALVWSGREYSPVPANFSNRSYRATAAENEISEGRELATPFALATVSA